MSESLKNLIMVDKVLDKLVLASCSPNYPNIFIDHCQLIQKLSQVLSLFYISIAF